MVPQMVHAHMPLNALLGAGVGVVVPEAGAQPCEAVLGIQGTLLVYLESIYAGGWHKPDGRALILLRGFVFRVRQRRAC